MRLDSMLPARCVQSTGNLSLAWLMLATAAVAASSLFAILIVMARVPGLGAMFPGTEFYRVALTLHVDLSQWVWFMAFAATLWTLVSRRAPGVWHWLALVLATCGALLMAMSPVLGAIRPLMSNYIPVLDSPWFLTGLGTYGIAVLIVAVLTLNDAAALLRRHGNGTDSLASVMDLGLWLAALVVIAAIAVLVVTYITMPADRDGLAFFETLFWGAGHIWQFCLTGLMLLAWIGLTEPRVELPAPRQLKYLLVAASAPALIAPLLLLQSPPGSVEYFTGFTRLMQWTSWQVPIFLGCLLLLRHWRIGQRPPTALSLSMLLLACGVILGAMIDRQTTLVTAHYHGTIGAVTLAFMGLTYGVLARFDCATPTPRSINWQLRLYGNGILLMMAGLAGAGMMGAPRKMAGNVAWEFGVETVSRLVLGLGGALATVGILMFLALVLRQMWPGLALRMPRHG